MRPMFKSAVLKELFRFGVVGALGFLVNAATTYGASNFVNLYISGGIAFLVAATFTWYLNRQWTFVDRACSPWPRQLRQFLGANFLGFLVYFAVYSTLIASSDLSARHPIFAVACGSIVGLAMNFTLSRAFVFTSHVDR